MEDTAFEFVQLLAIQQRIRDIDDDKCSLNRMIDDCIDSAWRCLDTNLQLLVAVLMNQEMAENARLDAVMDNVDILLSDAQEYQIMLGNMIQAAERLDKEKEGLLLLEEDILS